MTKLINYLLILFAFSLPLNHHIINILPLVIFILWLIEGDLQTKWCIVKRAKIFWYFIALMLVLLLSFLWSDSIYHGFWHERYHNGYEFWFRKYVYKFVIFPVLLTHVDKTLFKKMISAFLAGMFISEVVSYGIFFHLWKVGIGTPDDPSAFMHHVYYSAFLVFTIFILLVRFQRESERKWKLFYLLFASSAIVNLFINGGRTGQVAFVIAFIYFIFAHYRLTYKSLLATVGILLTIYYGAYIFSPVFQKKVAQTTEAYHKLLGGDMHSSIGGRIALYRTAWEIIKEHPVLGSGFGDVKDDIRQIQQKKFPNDAFINDLRHIHNQFLHTYLDAGIVGFLLIFLIASSIFITNFGEFDIYAKVFGISFVTLFMVDVPLTFNIGYLYIWTFLGMFFGYKLHEELSCVTNER